MKVSEDQVWSALREVPYPGFSRDVVSLGLVREVRVSGSTVALELVGGQAGQAPSDQVCEAVERAVRSVPGVEAVSVGRVDAQGKPSSLNVLSDTPARPAAETTSETGLIPGVRHAVAVASGKGGVGKSTVAVNLAVALARRGLSVGLLDADVYGPSIPLMMGMLREKPRIDPVQQQLLPLERFGVRFMSLGFLVDPEQAVIWRGPMVMKALEQLLQDVMWGDLDVLVLDLPPGTGDAQLTLSQRVQLAGAVIVTTPQDVALADAIKGVAMFSKVGVPVLGLVENMSYFQCPHCSERTDVFGHGGGRDQALRLGVPFLGEVPLEASIRSSGDNGTPVAAAKDPGAGGTAFLDLADAIRDSLQQRTPLADGPGWTASATRKEP